MVLFASLSKTKAFSDAQDPSKGKTAFPPTAVQFYSSKSIDLTSNSITDHACPKDATPSSSPRAETDLASFAPLTYQAVTIHSSTDNANNANLDVNVDIHAKPNLGIWNSRIHSNSKVHAETLKACHSNPKIPIPTFLITLDLNEASVSGNNDGSSNLHRVHPVMSSVLSGIIDYCSSLPSEVEVTDTGALAEINGNEESKKDQGGGEEKEVVTVKVPNRTDGTTNLSKLKSTTFGKAPLDDSILPGIEEDENEKNHDNGCGRGQSEININLIICGIFSKNQEVTYREKQAINLLMYHLQKFASELNCSLCLVKDEGKKGTGDGVDDDDAGSDGAAGDGAMGSNEANNDESRGGSDAFRPKGMSVQEFGRFLKKVCTASVEDEHDVDSNDVAAAGEDGEGQNEEQKEDTEQQPSLYGPYDYDVDLINSVLLRGAGCPGVWNANTDSLWVALPPPTSPEGSTGNSNAEKNNKGASVSGGHGDQEWLGKLAESVSAYVGSTGGSDAKSVRSAMDQTVRTTRTTSNNTVVTKKKVVRKKPTGSGDKKDSQDVQDFFADRKSVV